MFACVLTIWTASFLLCDLFFIHTLFSVAPSKPCNMLWPATGGPKPKCIHSIKIPKVECLVFNAGVHITTNLMQPHTVSIAVFCHDRNCFASVACIRTSSSCLLGVFIAALWIIVESDNVRMLDFVQQLSASPVFKHESILESLWLCCMSTRR